MKNLFCSYELSIKLKELGFNELCVCGYNEYKALKHNLASPISMFIQYIFNF